jgi:hypothetical protein
MAEIIEAIRYRSNDGHAYEIKLYSDGRAYEFNWTGDATEIEIPWEEYTQMIYDHPELCLLTDEEWDSFYD